MSHDASSSSAPFANAMAGWGEVFKAFVPAAAGAANPAVPMPGAAGGAAALPPGLAHWISASADPQELDKRIADLKTVKFWLDQNQTMVDNAIRALEVQRMTVATLQNLNVPVQSMMQAMAAPFSAWMGGPTAGAEAFTAAQAEAMAAERPAPEPVAAPVAAPAPSPAPAPQAEPVADSAADATGSVPAQWWGDLTSQFTRLAQAVVEQGQAAMQTGLSNVAAAQAQVAESVAKKPAVKKKSTASAEDGAPAQAASKAAPKTKSTAAVAKPSSTGTGKSAAKSTTAASKPASRRS